MTDRLACWCGNADLVAFCPGYVRCPACDTLVSSEMPGPEIAHVSDEERDFYGRQYWFSYQEGHRGNLPLSVRTRSDLPERCLHWLRTLLAYKRPPARVLELGSAHGGFVALLRLAGFDATGLEISPWVVEFARATFAVPMLLGPLEAQHLETASFDAIALMDVLEHLHDPTATMRRCLDLLKPDGILLIQTPCYPAGTSYEEFPSRNRDLLKILEPREHLHLFSPRSIRDFFDRLGAPHLTFEPALFHQYDMYAVVSRLPLRQHVADEGQALTAGPGPRIVQALLDKASELDIERRRHAEAEEDRSRRLLVIEEQGRQLGAVEAERNNLNAEVAAARHHIAALQEQIHALLAHLRGLQTMAQVILGTRTYRVLRALGRWKFIEGAFDEVAARKTGH